MNVEIVTEAAQFPEKEYINGIFLAVISLNFRPASFSDSWRAWLRAFLWVSHMQVVFLSMFSRYSKI
jgi:hypothetical protein